MTPAEIREYAETLILDQARDIDLLAVHEMAEECLPARKISDEDAKAVRALIRSATVTVSWPDTEPAPVFGTGHAAFVDHLVEDDR